MACINVVERQAGQVKDGNKERSVPFIRRLLVQPFAYFLGKTSELSFTSREIRAYQTLQCGHQQRTGKPFTRNVSDGNCDAFRAEWYEIVIVAAQLVRWVINKTKIQSWIVRQLRGKQTSLYLRCDFKFPYDQSAVSFILIFQRVFKRIYNGYDDSEDCKFSGQVSKRNNYVMIRVPTWPVMNDPHCPTRKAATVRPSATQVPSRVQRRNKVQGEK